MKTIFNRLAGLKVYPEEKFLAIFLWVIMAVILHVWIHSSVGYLSTMALAAFAVAWLVFKDR